MLGSFDYIPENLKSFVIAGTITWRSFVDKEQGF